MDKPCGCQHGRLRSLISAKLGRCRTCMRLSIIGTLAAWAMVGLLYALWPNPILLTLALLSAGSFTLLLVSHGVAFMARTAAQREARADRTVARRTFLGTLGKVAAAAVGASLLSRLGGDAISTPLLAAPPESDPGLSIENFVFDITWAQLIAGGGTYTAPLKAIRQYMGQPVFDLVGGKATFSLVASETTLGSWGPIPCGGRCYTIEMEAEFTAKAPELYAPGTSPSWCATVYNAGGQISGVSCMADYRMLPVGGTWPRITWRLSGSCWPREDWIMQGLRSIALTVGQPTCPQPQKPTTPGTTGLSRAERNQLVSGTLQQVDELLRQRAALAPLAKAERAVHFVQGVLAGLAELPNLVRDAAVVVYGLATMGEYPALEPASLLGQAWKAELEAGTPAWEVAVQSELTAAAIVAVPYALEASLAAGVISNVSSGNDQGVGANLAMAFQVAVVRSGQLRPDLACGCARSSPTSFPRTFRTRATAEQPTAHDFASGTAGEFWTIARMASESEEAGHGLVTVPMRSGKGQGLIVAASHKAWAEGMGVAEEVSRARLWSGRRPCRVREWDTEIMSGEFALKNYDGIDGLRMFGLKDPCNSCSSYLRRLAVDGRLSIRYHSAASNKVWIFEKNGIIFERLAPALAP